MAKITNYNMFVVLFAMLGGFSYGFAFSVFATSIGEPGFYLYFALDPLAKQTSDIIGAVTSLFAAGAAFGAIIQGWTSDFLGRRKALAIGGLVSLFGTALVAASVNIPMLMVFRFVSGLGVGQLLCLVPLYIAEVAPPKHRGFMSAGTGCSFSFGYLVSAWIGYGCFFAKNLTVQWRMPLCLCPITPLLLLIGCYWAPESPRWLIWNDRKDEAFEILRKLHHDPADSLNLAAKAEFIQIDKQVAFDIQTKHGYKEMFTIPSFRKRTLLAFFLIFSVQATGGVSITAYLPLEASAVGLKGHLVLLIYSVYVVVAVSFNFVNAFFIDKIGRRKMILIGISTMGLCLFALVLLQWKYSDTTNKGGNAAAILFINLFGACLGFFLDPTQFIWCAEVFPTTIRAKGLTISLFTYFVATILFTAPGATAFANIGYKYYIVFICCDVVSFALLYKYLPETTGLSLEEMGELFGDKVVTHLTADGTGLLEVDVASKVGIHVTQIENSDRISDTIPSTPTDSKIAEKNSDF